MLRGRIVLDGSTGLFRPTSVPGGEYLRVSSAYQLGAGLSNTPQGFLLREVGFTLANYKGGGGSRGFPLAKLGGIPSWNRLPGDRSPTLAEGVEKGSTLDGVRSGQFWDTSS